MDEGSVTNKGRFRPMRALLRVAKASRLRH